jgi:hypothetical protein
MEATCIVTTIGKVEECADRRPGMDTGIMMILIFREFLAVLNSLQRERIMSCCCIISSDGFEVFDEGYPETIGFCFPCLFQSFEDISLSRLKL